MKDFLKEYWKWLIATVPVGAVGAVIVFLVGYADKVEAKALAVTRAEVASVKATVGVAQSDIAQVKQRIETIDAGMRSEIRDLRNLVEQKAERQEKLIQDVLRETKRGR